MSWHAIKCASLPKWNSQGSFFSVNSLAGRPWKPNSTAGPSSQAVHQMGPVCGSACRLAAPSSFREGSSQVRVGHLDQKEPGRAGKAEPEKETGCGLPISEGPSLFRRIRDGRQDCCSQPTWGERLKSKILSLSFLDCCFVPVTNWRAVLGREGHSLLCKRPMKAEATAGRGIVRASTGQAVLGQFRMCKGAGGNHSNT